MLAYHSDEELNSQSFTPTQATQPVVGSQGEDDVLSGAEEEEYIPQIAWGEVRHTERSSDPQTEPFSLVDSSCIIGRGRGSDIRLNDSSISNKHCKLYLDDEKVPSVCDLGSSNGTWVNGKRLKKGKVAKLSEGTVLAFVRPKPPQNETDTIKKWYELKFTFPAVRSLSKRLMKKYKVLRKLGSGTYASVYKVEEIETGKEFAVKVIEKRLYRFSSQKLKEQLNEARVMERLEHPGIAKLHEIDDDDSAIYIVMELIRGGELFDRIIDVGPYPEEKAKSIVRNILQAVAYLHDQGILHRDLKPENIMMVDSQDDVTVKLVDFGVAKEEQNGRKTFCGTMDYVAPEVLRRKDTIMGMGSYGKAADLWSVGVIAFAILTARALYGDDSTKRNVLSIERQITEAFHSKEWKSQKLSPLAQDFVMNLLEIDAKKRLTARGALEHPWLHSSNKKKQSPKERSAETPEESSTRKSAPDATSSSCSSFSAAVELVCADTPISQQTISQGSLSFPVPTAKPSGRSKTRLATFAYDDEVEPRSPDSRNFTHEKAASNNSLLFHSPSESASKGEGPQEDLPSCNKRPRDSTYDRGLISAAMESIGSSKLVSTSTEEFHNEMKDLLGSYEQESVQKRLKFNLSCETTPDTGASGNDTTS